MVGASFVIAPRPHLKLSRVVTLPASRANTGLPLNEAHTTAHGRPSLGMGGEWVRTRCTATRDGSALIYSALGNLAHPNLNNLKVIKFSLSFRDGAR